ncbi:MAG: DUF3417 domain-containing protein, partial [Nitrososphaerales archaeon]
MSGDVTADTTLILPNELSHLTEIAENLYWSWNRRLRELFESIDPITWNSTGQNPIALLKTLNESKIEAL